MAPQEHEIAGSAPCAQAPLGCDPQLSDRDKRRCKWTQRRKHALWHKRVVWLAIGLAAAGATVLGELSQLLADIASEGKVAYSAAVFTSFTFAPVEAGHDLADAVHLWCPSGVEGASDCWLQFVYMYVGTDVLVAVSLAYLWYRFMDLVGLPETAAWRAAIALIVVNLVEKLSTALLVYTHAEALYAALRLFSAFKWAVIVGVLAFTAAGWAGKNTIGTISRQPKPGREDEHVSHTRAAATLGGPIIVLVLFLTLVAVPAGGPLDQLPDVVRNQLSELFKRDPNPWPLLGSVACLMAFFLALLVAASWSTSEPKKTLAKRSRETTPRMVTITLIGGSVLFAAEFLFDTPHPWVGLIPFALVCVLAGVDLAVRHFELHADTTVPDDPTHDKILQLASSWVPILPALAVTGCGVGLLRASFRPFVLGVEPRTPWLVGTVVAVAVALYGGGVTEWICGRIIAHKEDPRLPKILKPGLFRRRLSLFAAALVVVVAVVLAVRPELAKWLTSGGTVAVCLGLVALAVGGVHNLSRRSEPWAVTARLRLGRLRTPWLGILSAAWLIAVVIVGSGGFHDIRVYQNGYVATYANPSAAVNAWLTQAMGQDGRCVEKIIPSLPGEARSVVKMIMVAAPGGGIRAAYWTGSGLDAMTRSSVCGAGSIFAISGVSGGSVGTAAWLAARERPVRENVTAQDTVISLATDDALAASTASLFLRDLPQPFSGGSTSWRDRSKVMEDVMTSEAAPTFGSAMQPVRFPRAHLGWQPAVIFNGSSVTDGCRVLVTNVAELPSGPGPCESTAGRTGAVPGSLDVMAALENSPDSDGASCTGPGRGDMPLLTAALLSARFPVISPVGIIDRCLVPPGAPDNSGRIHTTYDLDGGYYENSGLLSLLQFWDAIRPIIQRCNSLAAAGVQAGDECPNAAAHVQIQPWIVVLDNHYESPAAAAPAPHQNELLLPVQALMNSSNVVGQANLEETARVDMRTFRLVSTTEDSGMFARIGPSKRPTVEAPLGWVLSETARCGLDEQLQTYAPTVSVLNPKLALASKDCAPIIKENTASDNAGGTTAVGQ